MLLYFERPDRVSMRTAVQVYHKAENEIRIGTLIFFVRNLYISGEFFRFKNTPNGVSFTNRCNK